jgi:hypothetical protein
VHSQKGLEICCIKQNCQQPATPKLDQERTLLSAAKNAPPIELPSAKVQVCKAPASIETSTMLFYELVVEGL